MYSHFQNMHITCGKMYGNSYNNRFLYSQRLYQGSDSLFYSHHILSDHHNTTSYIVCYTTQMPMILRVLLQAESNCWNSLLPRSSANAKNSNQ